MNKTESKIQRWSREGYGVQKQVGKEKFSFSELQKKEKLLCFSELFQVECLTPNCYVSSLLAKVIQLASKICLLLQLSVEPAATPGHKTPWGIQELTTC